MHLRKTIMRKDAVELETIAQTLQGQSPSFVLRKQQKAEAEQAPPKTRMETLKDWAMHPVKSWKGRDNGSDPYGLREQSEKKANLARDITADPELNKQVTQFMAVRETLIALQGEDPYKLLDLQPGAKQYYIDNSASDKADAARKRVGASDELFSRALTQISSASAVLSYPGLREAVEQFREREPALAKEYASKGGAGHRYFAGNLAEIKPEEMAPGLAAQAKDAVRDAQLGGQQAPGPNASLSTYVNKPTQGPDDGIKRR